jgi:hypothetical protein
MIDGGWYGRFGEYVPVKKGFTCGFDGLNDRTLFFLEGDFVGVGDGPPEFCEGDGLGEGAAIVTCRTSPAFEVTHGTSSFVHVGFGSSLEL